jgi:hypothetical protein
VVGARDYWLRLPTDLRCLGCHLGFAFSIDAPHAWKGDVRDGLIFGLIALALVIAAILLLRGSIRRLRSLQQIRMSDRNPR